MNADQFALHLAKTTALVFVQTPVNVIMAMRENIVKLVSGEEKLLMFMENIFTAHRVHDIFFPYLSCSINRHVTGGNFIWAKRLRKRRNA